MRQNSQGFVLLLLGRRSVKMNRLEKWKEVWEGKGVEGDRENLTLEDLIAMDGFDSSASLL
jgi:hypothetical protein